jgi:integrase
MSGVPAARRSVPVELRPARPTKIRKSHRGTIDLPSPKTQRSTRLPTWQEITGHSPQLSATMTAYLEQIAISSRPGTVSAADLTLRTFAAHLLEVDPSCDAVAKIARHHIESYKLSLASRQGMDPGRSMAVATIRHRLGMLRTFFERLIEWDAADAPKKVPIFTGDIPKADEPLPRFLDDPTYAKFIATLAKDTNLRRRVIVELLARTGMRAGEIGGIRDDAIFRLGEGHWLRIPIGKLHNDRTVPLHPVLLELIETYREKRGPSSSGLLVVRDDGQPFDRRTIHRYVDTVAKRAGVGHVHPHQLRHTLATQCINRGMSLEAIAAMLGHRSPRMTLVYARISNDSVADQYFRAIDAVERVGVVVPTNDDTEDETSSHQRQLANGHCVRPVQLDCSYQTICEGCGFFQTGPQFVTILRRQRDDATSQADFERAHLFSELIAGMTRDESSG